MSIGPLEVAIVVVILLLIFGPKKLPQLGRSLGGGMREFKDAITSRHDKDEDEESARDANEALGRPELTHADATPPISSQPDTASTPTGETRPGA